LSPCRRTDWRVVDAALRPRGSLLIWFDPEMGWLAVPSGRCGRPARVRDAAIRTCLMRKALFGLPLRQIEPWVRHGSAMGPSDHGAEAWWRAC
jgi:hypothetical protein